MDALSGLAPVSGAYATLPVAEAFNWSDAATELTAGEWYLVAFRSVRAPDADEAKLDEYDRRAHLEAAASPGFIHYQKGPRASDGTCMSFCLWQSRADARAAAAKPEHLRAVGLLDQMYERYTLEYHSVRREPGGPLTFEALPVVGHALGGATGEADAAGLGPAVPQLGIDPAPA
ncbi:MAG TPA: hypothetical protein VFV72_11135 [Candidatus Limnocylindrales bacterium]|nr:hypothetical protein [Candidatus Limnocylindrales bacterium]